MGVPTATVVSEPFAFKARREVEALGFGDLPIIVLPHPIGQLPRDEMREIATASFDEVLFILTTSPDDVARAYENRTTRERVAVT